MIDEKIQSLSRRINCIIGRLQIPDDVNRKYENLFRKRNEHSIYGFIHNELMEKI